VVVRILVERSSPFQGSVLLVETHQINTSRRLLADRDRHCGPDSFKRSGFAVRFTGVFRLDCARTACTDSECVILESLDSK